MFILVDYANIEYEVRRKGVSYIVDKIINLIEYSHFRELERVVVRLYGGWYDSNIPTRLSQQITTEISMDFPKKSKIISKTNSITVTVDVEQVYSIAIDPQKHLFYTYRIREFPEGISCNSPSVIGCIDSTCPLKEIYSLFQRGQCTRSGCNHVIEEFFYVQAQKLVDTMLSVDLLYYAQQKEKVIVIVSNDDDFWPPIKTSLLLGSKIIQVHPKKGRRTRVCYCAGIGSEYIQLSF